MARNAIKQRLREEIAVWFADGDIDEGTLTLLRDRYESRRFGWIGVVKYIGITGGLLAFFGIVGMISAMAESTLLAILMLGGVGGGITYWGMRLARDIRDRYAVSAKIFLTLGVVLWTSSIAIFFGLLGMKEESILLFTGLVSLPIGFLLAYRSQNQYLLILTLLALYHWIGSWNQMCGRSSYEFSVQDPQVMSLAALAGIAVGAYHERKLFPKTGRFFAVWESVGLLYLNLSLLILSIFGNAESASILWILVFTGATLAQIVLGSMWQNGIIRKFGITFFAINVFTRFHEHFWDQLQIGQYLCLGGGLLFILAACTEGVVRMLRRKRGDA